jgi:hypothetical protein
VQQHVPLSPLVISVSATTGNITPPRLRRRTSLLHLSLHSRCTSPSLRCPRIFTATQTTRSGQPSPSPSCHFPCYVSFRRLADLRSGRPVLAAGWARRDVEVGPRLKEGAGAPHVLDRGVAASCVLAGGDARRRTRDSMYMYYIVLG